MWDVTGVKSSDLGGDLTKLMMATMKVMQAHYPERTDRLFIVNAPRWFTTFWRVISPMVDPNTKQKIRILGDNFHEELFKYVAPENVPGEFGGNDPTPLGQSPEERQMAEFAAAISADGSCSSADSAAGAGYAADPRAAAGGGSPEDTAAVESRIAAKATAEETAVTAAAKPTALAVEKTTKSAAGHFGGGGSLSVVEVVLDSTTQSRFMKPDTGMPAPLGLMKPSITVSHVAVTSVEVEDCECQTEV